MIRIILIVLCAAVMLVLGWPVGAAWLDHLPIHSQVYHEINCGTFSIVLTNIHALIIATTVFIGLVFLSPKT